MKIRKGLLIFTAALCSISAVAQTEVTVGVTRGKDYGVTYILPKTDIEITVTATEKKYTPGEFSKYALRYLRLENISSEADSHWTLDKIQTAVVGVPDKENVYFVKLKDKTVAPLMELTKDGVICSINMPLGVCQPQETSNPQSTSPSQNHINPRDFLTEEILMANSTAKMAELVAKEIYSIRESKNALLRGEADTMPQDGEQLKLMLDNLNMQERALTEMFAGKTINEEKIFTIRVVPREMKDEVAFRFSKRLGIVANHDLSGEPIYITLTDLKSINIPPADPKKQILDGVAYNVPGRAHVTLSYNNKRLYDAEVPVTQFGVVEYLASVLFNKNSTIKVLFNPETGGLIKVDREN